MLSILLLFFLVVLVTFVVGELFLKIGFPRIVGQIAAGIFLGLPIFNFFFLEGSEPSLLLLSELGTIFLLILTGLEIDLGKLKKSSFEVVAIAFSSVLFSFSFGFAFGIILGQSLVISFVLGACLALTSEATKSIVLMQKGVLRTKLGELMLVAGTVDNVFELLFLALLLVFVESDSAQGLLMLPIEIIAFFVAVFILLKIIPRVMNYFQHESEDKYFTLTIIIGLGIAILSTMLSLGPIVGALMAGLLLKRAFKSQKVEHAVENNLKAITFGLVIPFFYLQIGLNFDSQLLALSPFLALAILVLGFAGKMIGVYAIKPFTKLNANQLVLVGWGMNSRGVMELVIAEIARQRIPGFPMPLYAAIVLMSIVTTFIFPFALNYYLKKYPGIMDE